MFDVTVLDLSPLVREAAGTSDPPQDLLQELLREYPIADVRGKLEYVQGDLHDSSLCRGPYDMIVERRTLQLFPDDRRPRAIAAVADRLAMRGIFFSQSHNGGWRPPEPRIHRLAESFDKQGWPRLGPGPLSGRAVWLLMTTG